MNKIQPITNSAYFRTQFFYTSSFYNFRDRKCIVQSFLVIFQLLFWCLVTKLCQTILQSYGLQPARLLCPWDFPSKNTGVGCHLLLHRIFLTQGLNLCLLCSCDGRQILYHQQHLGRLKQKLFTSKDRETGDGMQFHNQ